MKIRSRNTIPARIILFIVLFSAILHAQDVKENSDYKLAVGLYNDGMYDLAIDQLQHFIAAYSSSPQAVEGRYYIGMAQLRSRRYAEARASLQNFAMGYPDHPKAAEAWMSAAKTFADEGNFGEAASAYARLRMFHPKSPLVPEALMSAAQMFRTSANPHGAEQALRTLLSECPATPQARSSRLFLADIYSEEGNDLLARQEFGKAIQNSTFPAEKAHCIRSLGDLEVRECLFLKAESTFTSVLRLQPAQLDRAGAEAGLATVYNRRGDYAKSQKLLTSALARKDFPDSLRPATMYTLATAYRGGGNNEAALKILEELASSSPAKIGSARWDAAHAALATGNRERAYQLLRPLLDALQSGDDQSLLHAAQMLASLGKSSEAARLYSDFLGRFPGHPAAGDALLNLAELYEGPLDKLTEAAPVYRRASEQFSNSPIGPSALIRLAEICEKRRQFAEAGDAYRLLLRNFPAIETADTIRRRIELLSRRTVVNNAEVLRELSSLIADLADNKPKAEILYRLGSIAFNNLRDYAAAREYFQKSLAAGLPSELKSDALFALAECLRFDAEENPSIVPNAVAAYNDILSLTPPSSRFDDAVLAKYLLETSGAGPLRRAELASSYQTHYPASAHANRFGFDRAVAELSSGNTVHALTLLKKLTAESLTPAIQGKALLLYGDQLAARAPGDSATFFWNRALELTPSSSVTVGALSRLADAASGSNPPEKTLGFLQRLADEFGYTATGDEAQTKIPLAYAAAGQYEPAIRASERLLNDRRRNPLREQTDRALLCRTGELYGKKGDRDNAARCFRTFLSDGPDDSLTVGAYLELGAIEKIRGNAILSSAYFHEASSLNVSSSSSDRRIADLFFENGQYGNAATHYLALSRTADSIALRRYYLGRAILAELRLGAAPEADKIVQSSADLLDGDQPLLGEIEYERGLAWYRKERYTEAQQCFRTVQSSFAASPFAPWSEYYLGKISEIKNKPEEAVKRYEHILSAAPSADVIPRVNLALGNMHFNAERYEQAIGYFQKVIADSARSGDVTFYALNNLIEAYESLKLYDAAIASARSFIQKYPNDESITDKNIKLGTLYRKIGYYDQAIEQFRRILAEAGSSAEAEIFYDIGDAYFGKGEYEKAILEFLKVPYTALSQGKVNWTATALYMAGQSYEKLSKLAEALQMYQQIVDRSGIDASFKAAAQKEIARVRSQYNGQ